MKIGILGGTFNPIHIGHLTIAEHACDELGLNRLLIIPAAIPPHKQGEKIVEAGHRLEMVKLATRDNQKFEISDIELKRQGVSYSVETLRIIQAKVKVLSEYYLIVGSDMVGDLDTWKEIDKLIEMCTFVVAVRPGFKKKNWKQMGVNLPESIRDKVLQHTLENPMVEVSSTDIRRRVREGKSIRHMVPKAVEEYIIRQGLYKD
jgi:nicotinate-nucleotide adenylyltransferase